LKISDAHMYILGSQVFWEDDTLYVF